MFYRDDTLEDLVTDILTIFFDILCLLLEHGFASNGYDYLVVKIYRHECLTFYYFVEMGNNLFLPGVPSD